MDIYFGGVMAALLSFDIVSRVDRQELDNAVNQANKEIGQRYDFKGSVSRIEIRGEDLVLISDDELKLKAVVDVLKSKLYKRKIGLKALQFGRIEPAAKGTVRQTVHIRQGIDRDNAKRINTLIKNSKRKVTSRIQQDQIRVSGKSRDDLQYIIGMLKEADLDLELQFVNYK